MVGAVLWDMDGTLVDSAEYHWQAWRDTMADESMHITYAQFLATFGLRNDSIIPQWLPGVPTADVARIGDAKEARYRRRVREGGLSPLDGAAELVRRLNREGWRQAVASSAPRANLDTVLEVTGMAAEFQAIVAAEDVRRGKPDPEVFLTAAAQLGIAPQRSIVVEDAASGIEAARRAGMGSVGVSRSGAPLPADLVVRSLADLDPDAFQRLLAVR